MNAPDKGIVNIHGREYQTVALRVKLFRERFPDFTLKTEIIARDQNCVVMEAQILSDSGRLIANGHAEEYRTSSSINKTSALENCETSCIGRALAAFGLGGTEFATADEVANAITSKQPVKATRITPTTGAWNEMDDAQKAVLTDIALEVIDILDTPDRYDDNAIQAVNFIKSKSLSQEEAVALWTRFDSKQRAALKRTKESINSQEQI